LASWGLQVASGATPFEFKENDVVAIFGNGLADRMQHDPWVETTLQSHLKGQSISFRNMSFSGDMVNKRPRNQGFTSDADYIQHVAPDVVFIFYGYNEAFAGAAGAADYRTELVKLVQQIRQWRGEAGKEVRLVLFSPIAYENNGDRLLPDGTELNANLAVYTEATRQAAAQADVTCSRRRGRTLCGCQRQELALAQSLSCDRW